MITDKPNFFDYDLTDLENLLVSWGEPGYRIDQVWRGMYQDLKVNPDEISNIPKNLRIKLKNYFNYSNLLTESTLISANGQTEKTLFRLRDKLAIETVLMRYEKRRTLCISTQSGCALGCVFCATGQMGFGRHLTSGEIIEQVILFERILRENDESLTNVVVMGMGEPFHNYDNTMAALDRLNHPRGLNMGARRFTVSTVGLIPQILRFAKERRQINLAISLHAAEDELRNSILPINKRYPLQDLMDACREYVNNTHRRITFEWALILGVNDTEEQANKLAELLHGLICHVNIIPLNPTNGYAGKATTIQRAQIFKGELERKGISCTIRVRRGIDIQAGCGQLASEA